MRFEPIKGTDAMNHYSKTLIAGLSATALWIASGSLFPTGQCDIHGSAQAQGDPVVALATDRGTIFIRVFLGGAPNTARNFLDLVQRGFYSGKIFHRVERMLIQGGDPNGNGSGNFIDPDTGRPRFIQLECNPNLRHNQGAVAMARSRDPNSASCQFYITKERIQYLDGQYAVFGTVVDGMNAVFAIQRGDRIRGAEIVQGRGGGGGGGSASMPQGPSRATTSTTSSPSIPAGAESGF